MVLCQVILVVQFSCIIGCENWIKTRTKPTNILVDKANENKTVGQRVGYRTERYPLGKEMAKHTKNRRYRYRRRNKRNIVALKHSIARTWHKRNKLSKLRYSKRNKQVWSQPKGILQSSFRGRKQKTQGKRRSVRKVEGKSMDLMCNHLMISIFQIMSWKVVFSQL